MGLVLNVVLGLLGLGIVIFIHELGHFLAARAVGIGVEVFSLGWGPRIAGLRRGGTEYRVSAFPIGGYCLMKGEAQFRQALESNAEEIPREEGTFYGASPWKRIVVSLAGPVANLAFAALVFVFVSLGGYEVSTSANRIVLQSQYAHDKSGTSAVFAADKAGLQSGDRILATNGRPIGDFYDLQQAITDSNPGAMLGVTPWTETVVASVEPGSAADVAGIKVGDRLLSLGGASFDHAVGLMALLDTHPERISLTAERNGQTLVFPLILTWDKSGYSDLGIGFPSLKHHVGAKGLLASLGDGLAETGHILSLTVRSILILIHKPDPAPLELQIERDGSVLRLTAYPSFDRLNLVDSVSGPARITWMIGSAASASMGEGLTSALASVFDLLAFLSIGLFIMNLLPIPALDGGQILLFLLEGARRKPFKAKTVYRFQFFGAFFIIAIFSLAMLSDFMFFSR